jgi:hypothetical protein
MEKVTEKEAQYAAKTVVSRTRHNKTNQTKPNQNQAKPSHQTKPRQ